jgi:hypothetical protein
MVWFAELTSAPLIVTPGATVRLLKLPKGALSKVISDPPPSPATAASKLAAAAAEFGFGLVVVAIISSPEKVTGAAEAETADPAVTNSTATMTLAGDIASTPQATESIGRSLRPHQRLPRGRNFRARRKNRIKTMIYCRTNFENRGSCEESRQFPLPQAP